MPTCQANIQEFYILENMIVMWFKNYQIKLKLDICGENVTFYPTINLTSIHLDSRNKVISSILLSFSQNSTIDRVRIIFDLEKQEQVNFSGFKSGEEIKVTYLGMT